MNRRRFLQSAALVPAAGVADAGADAGGLAGSLARLAFLDDAAALVVHSPAMPGAVARAVAEHSELFVAGSALQPLPDQPAAALAIRAGQAALQSYASIEPKTASEKLQWDALLLQELAHREGRQGRTPPKQDIADLFEILDRRVLIAIHTYIPDEEDVDGWMVRLIRLHEDTRAYWSRLAESWRRNHLGPPDRYDAADDLVRAATSLRHGSLDPAAITRAIQAQPRSAYGLALREAHHRIGRLRANAG